MREWAERTSLPTPKREPKKPPKYCTQGIAKPLDVYIPLWLNYHTKVGPSFWSEWASGQNGLLREKKWEDHYSELRAQFGTKWNALCWMEFLKGIFAIFWDAELICCYIVGTTYDLVCYVTTMLFMSAIFVFLIFLQVCHAPLGGKMTHLMSSIVRSTTQFFFCSIFFFFF